MSQAGGAQRRQLEDSFAELLGRQPSELERARLHRIREVLGIGSNDALWLILMALESYNSLYAEIPDQIKRAAKVGVSQARRAARGDGGDRRVVLAVAAGAAGGLAVGLVLALAARL